MTFTARRKSGSSPTTMDRAFMTAVIVIPRGAWRKRRTMTEKTADRRVRDVLRALDGQLDELLIRVRYSEPTADGRNPARALEKLVGTAEAKLFLQDEIDDAAKRRRTTIRALISAQKTREHVKRS